MKRKVFLFLCLLLIVFNGFSKVRLIVILGQSNASGRGLWERASVNDLYAYKGISNPTTGYPNTRNGRPNYVKQPSGVYMYYYGDDRNQNYITATGTWQLMNVGVNTRTDQAGVSTAQYFGCEVSMGQQLKSITGDDVYIIKLAWGGTGIGYDTPPGTYPSWLWYYRNVAGILLQKGINDLKAARPNDEVEFMGFVWWQGEGNNSASAAQYKLYWYRVYEYMQNRLMEVLTLKSPLKWYCVKLYYALNPGEDEKNLSFDQLATENPGRVFTINISRFPRKLDLTVAEALPIAKAPEGTNNSVGVEDDNHNSYISQYAAGELLVNSMLGITI